MAQIDGKIILVTGGTGSFGNMFVEQLLKYHNPKKVIIFSRDEKKQYDMRMKLNDPRVDFEIGDVRDRERVFQVMKEVDYVFHAAALKQVPSCEFFPLEAVKTNILGTANVIDAAIENGVKKFIGLSTDKAVYPINAMGISKAMMEKVMIAKSRNSGNTVICLTRYGNVLCSRGSVIPLFTKQIKENKPITVTNGDMTRFLLTLTDAVDLIFYALENGKNGELFVKKSKSCTMFDLANKLKHIFKSDSEIKEIGIRHGEKMHETLISREEMLRTEDLDDFYKILPDNRDLNYNNYFTEGKKTEMPEEYTSFNTKREDELTKLLLCLPYVYDELKENNR